MQHSDTDSTDVGQGVGFLEIGASGLGISGVWQGLVPGLPCHGHHDSRRLGTG